MKRKISILLTSVVMTSQFQIANAQTLESDDTPQLKMDSKGVESESLPSDLGNLFTPLKDSFWRRQWEKLRVTLDGKILNEQYNIGERLGINTRLDYKYEVKPAYIKDFHQRFDKYRFNLGGGLKIADYVSVGASFSADVTFSRIFDDKEKAIKAPVYFLNRIPWNHDYAIKYLNPGDVVRIELGTDSSLGTGAADNGGHEVSNASVGASISRGSKFLVDFYKMKNQQIRVRVITVRSEGNANFNIGLDPINKVNVGNGILNRFISKWLYFKLFDAGASKNINDNYPMDTAIVDYIYNLNDSKAQNVFNATMREIRNGQVIRLLNFQTHESKTEAKMMSLFKATEDFFINEQLNLPSQQRVVDRVFKGDTVSSFSTMFAESKFRIGVQLWKLRSDSFSNKSIVRGFDNRNNPVEMIYLGKNLKNDKEFVYGLGKSKYEDSMNCLVLAKNPKDFDFDENMPLQFQDLIFSKNIEESNLDASSVDKMQNYLKFSVPTIYEKIDWSKLSRKSNKTNGYLRATLIVQSEALKLLPAASTSELYTLTRKFFDAYPNKDLIENHQQPVGDSSSTVYDRYEADIVEFSYRLSEMLNDTNPVKRLQAFELLKGYPLFREIGPAILVSLIPVDKVNSVITLNLNGATDQGEGINFSSGGKGSSDIYKNLNYMMEMINNRSFDLRLQIDQNGSFQNVKSNSLDPNTL